MSLTLLTMISSSLRLILKRFKIIRIVLSVDIIELARLLRSNELINHILSYRGPHPTAVIWNDVLIGLNDMSQKHRDVLSFITYYFYVNKVDLIYKKEFLLYEEYEDFFNRIAGRSHNYRVGEVINDYEIRMEYYRRSYCHSCDVYDLDVSIGLNPTPLHCYIEYR